MKRERSALLKARMEDSAFESKLDPFFKAVLSGIRKGELNEEEDGGLDHIEMLRRSLKDLLERDLRDVFKFMEGASWIAWQGGEFISPDLMDYLVREVAAVQESDGYIPVNKHAGLSLPIRWAGENPWGDPEFKHELGIYGYLYEAAVARFVATGKSDLLEVAIRNADLVTSVYGPSGKPGVPGHQEIEIGLLKLYRLTGEVKYLEQCRFFLGEHGRFKGRRSHGELYRDNRALLEQRDAVGLVQRGGYMYAAMAEQASLSGDSDLRRTIERIWSDFVSSKINVTGAPSMRGGKFSEASDLPITLRPTELDASVSIATWCQEMSLLSHDSGGADVLEWLLLNSILPSAAVRPERNDGEEGPAAVSMDSFRYLASLPSQVYEFADGVLYVNLYFDSRASLRWESHRIVVTQTTSYPKNGVITVRLEMQRPVCLTLALRVPGWTRARPIPGSLYRFRETCSETVKVKVRGCEETIPEERGYLSIRRKWTDGDDVCLEFPMPKRQIAFDSSFRQDVDRVAIANGPVLFALRDSGNSVELSDL